MSALKNFAGRFFAKFSRDETMTLAASLAFYTAFSLAPILILFVTCASFLSPELQGQFVEQVRDLVGPEAALTIEAVIDGAKDRQDLTSIAGLTGLLTLMISASLIFGELRNALNKIFEVSPPSDEKISVIVMILRYLKGRLVQIVLAFGFIMTIIISLGISSAISATLQSERAVAAALINILASFITYVLLFTLMFRFIPARRQPL